MNGEILLFWNFYIVIGVWLMMLNIFGEELLVISIDFFELFEWLDWVVFVGGGFIVMEFVYIFKCVGVWEVMVLEMME